MPWERCRLLRAGRLAPRPCCPSLARGRGNAGHPAARRLSLVPLQVDSKVTLGLGGVSVVLGAVTAAMGFFSYLGVPSSLVILQVVPFLVLAVGADNIFIFVLEYQVRARGSPPLAAAALHPRASGRLCSCVGMHVRGSCRERRVPCHLRGTCVPVLALPQATMPSAERLGLVRGMPRTDSES